MGLRVICTAVIASLSWPLLQVVQQSDWFDYLGFDLPVTSFAQHIELVYSMATSPWLSTLSSLSSMSSISPGPGPAPASSSTMASVNEASNGPLWCGHDGVTDVLPQYYYYYGSCFGSDWYQYYDVCSCNVESVSDSTARQSLSRQVSWWFLASVVLVALCVLAKPILCRLVRVVWWFVQTAWLVLDACRYVARNDLHEVWQAVLFLACQLVLILSKRVPTGAGRIALRRFALRHRPYAPASLVTGEVVFMANSPGGSITPSTPASARRSLLQIQSELQIVAGGFLLWRRRRTFLPAKRVCQQRFRSHCHSAWQTVYNPSSRTGDCLFLALSKALRFRASASSIRRMLQDHAEFLLRFDIVVHNGQTLASVLKGLGITPERYLRNLAGRNLRWGNTIDVIVAADLFQQQIKLVDLIHNTVLVTAGTQFTSAVFDIGYAHHHFVAGRHRQRQVCRPQRPVYSHYVARSMAVLACVLCTFTSLCSTSLGQASSSVWCLCCAVQALAVLYRDYDCGLTSQPAFHCGGAKKGTGRRFAPYAAGTSASSTDAPVCFACVGSGEEDERVRHVLCNTHDVAAQLATFERASSEAGDSDDAIPIAGAPLEPDHFLDVDSDADDFERVMAKQVATAQAVRSNFQLERFNRKLTVTLAGEPAIYDDVEQPLVGEGAMNDMDDSVHILLNPAELGALVEAHDDEITTPPGDPPSPRNLAETNDPREYAAILYYVMALRHLILARWPNLRYPLMQYGRSPNGENDLPVVYGPCVCMDDFSLHGLGNPATFLYLQHQHVAQHMAARRLPLSPRHVHIPVLQALPQQAPRIDRDILLAQLRDRIRAVAEPAGHYDDPLDDVGLGGYPVVEGGARSMSSGACNAMARSQIQSLAMRSSCFLGTQLVDLDQALALLMCTHSHWCLQVMCVAEVQVPPIAMCTLSLLCSRLKLTRITQLLALVMCRSTQRSTTLSLTSLSCVSGGAGNGKRRRSPSWHAAAEQDCAQECADIPPSFAGDVVWPTWLYATQPGEELRTVHVSVGECEPTDIQVPCSWSQDQMESSFARHVAARPEWLEFVWINQDVSIEYSGAFPDPNSHESAALSQCFHSLPRRAAYRRESKRTNEIVIGHRASRKPGITAYTKAHPDEVRALVQCVCQCLPGVVFNAAALVAHQSIPPHKDEMNDGEVVLAPQSLAPQAWLWFESPTGADSIVIHGRTVAGAWLPYNRPCSFAATSFHMVQADLDLASLVLYRTARMPSRAHLAELVHLEFPLCAAELAKLSAEESDQPSDDFEPGHDHADSDYSDVGGEQDVAAEPLPAPSRPEPIILRQPGIAIGAPAVELTVAKMGVDGLLRSFRLFLAAGSTMRQAKGVLKTHLKLNIVKLALFPSEDSRNELTDEKVVCDVDSPCFLRIRPSADAPPAYRSRSHFKAHSLDLPIGARIKPAKQARVAAPRPTSAISSSSTPTPSTAFERWVAGRLREMDKRQTEILQAIRNMQQSASVASSSFVAGGGKSTHQDAVKRQRETEQPPAAKRRPCLVRPVVQDTSDVLTTVTIIYHGSFAPFHIGHRACVDTAIQYLTENEVVVTQVIIGCTLPEYLRSKVEASGFEDASLRVRVIRAVLADGPPLSVPVIVSDQPHRTPCHLARCHASAGARLIYLVGEDMQKRVSPETLIVTRTTEGLWQTSKFCHKTLAGRCVQNQHLDISSTSVRRVMEQGYIPRHYGPAARKLINAVVYKLYGKPAGKEKSVKGEATNRVTATSSKPATSTPSTLPASGAATLTVQTSASLNSSPPTLVSAAEKPDTVQFASSQPAHTRIRSSIDLYILIRSSRSMLRQHSYASLV
eukprot:2027360-Amphidinium_carterae.3